MVRVHGRIRLTGCCFSNQGAFQPGCRSLTGMSDDHHPPAHAVTTGLSRTADRCPQPPPEPRQLLPRVPHSNCRRQSRPTSAARRTADVHTAASCVRWSIAEPVEVREDYRWPPSRDLQMGVEPQTPTGQADACIQLIAVVGDQFSDARGFTAMGVPGGPPNPPGLGGSGGTLHYGSSRAGNVASPRRTPLLLQEPNRAGSGWPAVHLEHLGGLPLIRHTHLGYMSAMDATGAAP